MPLPCSPTVYERHYTNNFKMGEISGRMSLPLPLLPSAIRHLLSLLPEEAEQCLLIFSGDVSAALNHHPVHMETVTCVLSCGSHNYNVCN